MPRSRGKKSRSRKKIPLKGKSPVQEKKKGPKLSITKGDCKEEKFQEWRKRGVGLATSVETKGVELRTRTRQLGAEEKTEGTSAP